MFRYRRANVVAERMRAQEKETTSELAKKIMGAQICFCATCNNLLEAPIRLWDEGNICSACCMHMELEDLKRNWALEFILKELVLPCSNTPSGCTEEMKINSLIEHHKICKFRSMECWLPNCEFRFQPKNMTNHFLEAHPKNVLKNTSGLYLLNIQLKTELNSLYYVLDVRCPCFLQIKFNRQSNYIEYLMYDASEINENFECTIEHVPVDGFKSMVIKCPLLNMSKIDNSNFATKVKSEDLTKVTGLSNIVSLMVRTKSTDVGKLDAKVKESLECPICNWSMRPPIYMCLTGHSFCNKCEPRLTNCPTCRSSINCNSFNTENYCHKRRIRNYALENLTSEIFYNCKFESNGCKEVFLTTDLDRHESNCRYATQSS